MKVVLLGLEFSINNLGCEALSYSFVSELYEIAKQQGKEIDVKAVVFADRIIPYIPNTKQAVDCIKIKYKSPSFWKEISREFKSSDMIIDFTMGDSFSDIYGKKSDPDIVCRSDIEGYRFKNINLPDINSTELWIANRLGTVVYHRKNYQLDNFLAFSMC